MGTLKPGATYVYERQGGTVYAREMGAPFDQRIVVGYDWELDHNPDRVRGASPESVRENQYWHTILIEAKSNPRLQEAVDRVKVLYELIKNNE